MSGLLSSLQTSAQAFRVIDRQIAASQNNVNNVQTPGYAKQTVSTAAMPFDLSAGLTGGVTSLDAQSSRNQFAEQSVRGAVSDSGSQDIQNQMLSMLEGVVPVDTTKGVSGALTKLWDSFSSWSTSPNSGTERDSVLNAAKNLATAFNQAATQVSQLRQSADQQSQATVTSINQLTTQIAALNAKLEKGGPDAGVDAQLHAALEELSGLTNVSVLMQANGTANVLMDGQIPLVMGSKSSDLSVSITPQGTNVPPKFQLLAADGQDVTAHATGGTLGGLIAFRTGAIAELEGDGTQPGSLNTLAASVADRINGLLTSGYSSLDPEPVAGVPLFQYSSGQNAALSLQVVAGFESSDLAAAEQGDPPVVNGTALKLAALRDSGAAADQIDGQTYGQYLAGITSSIGFQADNASDRADSAADAVVQARSLREQISGVSLDEEAAKVLELQRAYQANATMIQVLSEMTLTLIQSVS
ncbi:flagellar hook-associated protein FlgK [uncultured Paludibaculum sp.]|uniref:flagellar hook-associated protein FlgK n=1 Tax=uncultured Paludibaculum sp. TaxID=1765020 RepID=UPI002AAA6CBE|nr:flagellar hook-associated protein FlgK [uncultured Paludibaculum sp.]